MRISTKNLMVRFRPVMLEYHASLPWRDTPGGWRLTPGGWRIPPVDLRETTQ